LLSVAAEVGAVELTNDILIGLPAGDDAVRDCFAGFSFS